MCPRPCLIRRSGLLMNFIENNASAMSQTGSKDNSSLLRIYNSSLGTLTHELTHAFVGIVNEDKKWMNEGFADFFSLVAFTDPSTKDAFYNSVRNNANTGGLCIDSYVKVEGVPEEPEDINMLTAIDAHVYAYWCGDEEMQVPKIMNPLAEYGYVGNSKLGAELSYWEAESFVSYLIENYSFEDTWNCMTSDLSFEEVYGKPYKLLKREWMFHIRDKFS